MQESGQPQITVMDSGGDAAGHQADIQASAETTGLVRVSVSHLIVNHAKGVHPAMKGEQKQVHGKPEYMMCEVKKSFHLVFQVCHGLAFIVKSNVTYNKCLFNPSAINRV
jgi:hypothetical protein